MGAALLAYGCAALGDPSLKGMMGAGAHIDKWQGKHRDELTKSPDWGKPAEERAREDGGKALVYKRGYKMPGQHFRYSQDCTIIFHTDGKGIVNGGTYDGC